MTNTSKRNSSQPAPDTKKDGLAFKYKLLMIGSFLFFTGVYIYIWARNPVQVQITQAQAVNGPVVKKTEKPQPKDMLLATIPEQTKTLYAHSQRLEDTNNVMWALLVTLMHETMIRGKQPADTATLIELAKAKNKNGVSLWMDRWQVAPNKQGVRTEFGYLLLYYRPQPLALEIRNVPYESGGQILLMRVPEADGSPIMSNTDFIDTGKPVAGVLMLISPSNGTLFPPFTPKQVFRQANWREEPIKLSTSNTEERFQIAKRWVEESEKEQNRSK